LPTAGKALPSLQWSALRNRLNALEKEARIRLRAYVTIAAEMQALRLRSPCPIMRTTRNTGCVNLAHRGACKEARADVTLTDSATRASRRLLQGCAPTYVTRIRGLGSKVDLRKPYDWRS
jgi:uncharacterized protein YhdP